MSRPRGYTSSWPISKDVTSWRDHSNQLFAFKDRRKSAGQGGTPAIVFSLMIGFSYTSGEGVRARGLGICAMGRSGRSSSDEDTENILANGRPGMRGGLPMRDLPWGVRKGFLLPEIAM